MKAAPSAALDVLNIPPLLMYVEREAGTVVCVVIPSRQWKETNVLGYLKIVIFTKVGKKNKKIPSLKQSSFGSDKS